MSLQLNRLANEMHKAYCTRRNHKRTKTTPQTKASEYVKGYIRKMGIWQGYIIDLQNGLQLQFFFSVSSMNIEHVQHRLTPSYSMHNCTCLVKLSSLYPTSLNAN